MPRKLLGQALTQENLAITRYEIGRRDRDLKELAAALAALDGALDAFKLGGAGFNIDKVAHLRTMIVSAIEAARR